MAVIENVVTNCSAGPIVLAVPAGATFDMIQTRENMLVGGQRIAKCKDNGRGHQSSIVAMIATPSS